jgi:predicted cupin superfamily sugar epimerase
MTKSSDSAEALIKHLGLQPLPVEGGWFRETWRAEDAVSAGVLPTRYTSARSFGSAIYYLLTSAPDCFSALHRLAGDEVYHFYLGDPVEMLLLSPQGEAQRIVLGQDVLGGQHLQYVVPRGVWQGSRLLTGGSFALLGTTMAPAFDPQDFEAGSREELLRLYPQQAELIRALTR